MPFLHWLPRTSLTGSTPDVQRDLAEPYVAPLTSMTSRVGESISLASYWAGPLVLTVTEAPSEARSMLTSLSWTGESAVWLEPIPVTASDSATTRPAIRALLIRSVPPSYLYWFSGRRSVRLEALCEPRAETANVTEFGVIPVTRPSPRASPGLRM